MDKLWILRSNLCPCPLEIGKGLTELGLGLDGDWTLPVIGQRLDKVWTKIGFCLHVQPTIVENCRNNVD